MCAKEAQCPDLTRPVPTDGLGSFACIHLACPCGCGSATNNRGSAYPNAMDTQAILMRAYARLARVASITAVAWWDTIPRCHQG